MQQKLLANKMCSKANRKYHKANHKRTENFTKRTENVTNGNKNQATKNVSKQKLLLMFLLLLLFHFSQIYLLLTGLCGGKIFLRCNKLELYPQLCLICLNGGKIFLRPHKIEIRTLKYGSKSVYRFNQNKPSGA